MSWMTWICFCVAYFCYYILDQRCTVSTSSSIIRWFSSWPRTLYKEIFLELRSIIVLISDIDVSQTWMLKHQNKYDKKEQNDYLGARKCVLTDTSWDSGVLFLIAAYEGRKYVQTAYPLLQIFCRKNDCCHQSFHLLILERFLLPRPKLVLFCTLLSACSL